jgi:predicted dehydrogenase
MSLPVAICGLSARAARRPESSPFGWVVASHAAAYATHAGCNVVAVCDSRRDLAAEFRETWLDFWPAVVCYPRLDLLLAEVRPAIVSIATPEPQRAATALTALAGGVRGLLCEKPMATSAAEGAPIVAAVRAAGAHLVVYQPKRYDPLIHFARDVVRSGELGELRRLRCYHGGSRALLFRTGVHAIDTLCFLAESPVVEVTGRLEPGFEDYQPYLTDRLRDPLREPTASARLTFANDVVAHYDGVRHGRRVLWFDIEGSRGGLRVHERHAELTTDGGTRVLAPPPYDRVGLAAAVSELVVLVTEGGQTVSPPEDGIENLRVLDAVLASARVGGERVLVA